MQNFSADAFKNMSDHHHDDHFENIFDHHHDDHFKNMSDDHHDDQKTFKICLMITIMIILNICLMITMMIISMWDLSSWKAELEVKLKGGLCKATASQILLYT